jgi:orotidine-5'-phosphate decarboxylase
MPAELSARERLILALDLPSVEAAREVVRRVEGAVEFFKVGLSLQLAPGAEGLVRWLLDEGHKVFLDYKYYDVPETLRKAVAQAARLGVDFLTIHGSTALIHGAIEGRGASKLKLFCVTVLTSMDTVDMEEMGYSQHTVKDLVLFRARKALEAGCDGVISSGHETAQIKTMSGDRLLVVNPGIREDDAPGDDQKRRMTARDAILAGADYLVVGRPITGKADPKAEAERIVQVVESALSERFVSSQRS